MSEKEDSCILNEEKLREIVQEIEKTQNVQILESYVRAGTNEGNKSVYL